jgi:hypothetical protein
MRKREKALRERKEDAVSARRILVLTAVFVLVAVSVAAGFLFSGETSSRILVVDLRALPTAEELAKETTEGRTGVPMTVVANAAQLPGSCATRKPAGPAIPAYCAILNSDPITLITDDQNIRTADILQKFYGHSPPSGTSRRPPRTGSIRQRRW